MSKIQALFDNVQVSAGPLTVKTGVATRSPLVLLSETIHSVDEHLPDGLLFVVAMDEVPMALSNIASNEGPAAAGQMLQALRELRRRRGRMRWIVCGSIGFHHILRRCDATEAETNDLVNLPLGPLKPEEASELAERLLLGIKREAREGAVATLVQHSGCIPFLIHHLAHRLYDAGSGPVSAVEVAGAFTDFVEDRDESRAVTHLLTRLEPLYREHTPLAHAILDAVAVKHRTEVTDLEPNDRVLRSKLVDDLVDDHYLIEHAGVVSWRYDVLRRIWVHRRRLA